MRYVGIINHQDFILALREDGLVYRIAFNYFTGQAVAVPARTLVPTIEEVVRLPQGHVD